MTALISTRFGPAIAVGAVAAAVAVPIALAGSGRGNHVEPPWILHYTEPGSTGYLPKSQFTIHYREPGS